MQPDVVAGSGRDHAAIFGEDGNPDLRVGLTRDKLDRGCIAPRAQHWNTSTTHSAPSGSLARVCQTARRFKDLARRFLKVCVSGCALARGFLVSAPPVSAPWKPFPGAECRDRFATVGDRFAQQRAPPRHPLAFNSAHGAESRDRFASVGSILPRSSPCTPLGSLARRTLPYGGARRYAPRTCRGEDDSGPPRQ